MTYGIDINVKEINSEIHTLFVSMITYGVNEKLEFSRNSNGFRQSEHETNLHHTYNYTHKRDKEQ